jgi:peptidoglycan-associated lipoprotein
MKIFRILTLMLFASLLVSPEISAQQKRNFTQEADQAFDDQMYYTAIDKYKKAYSKVKSNRTEKKRILFQIAECYRLTGNAKRAESQYKRMIRIGYQKTNPLTLLYYADALMENEKYAEAAENYQAYIELAPEDPRGRIGLESTELTVKWMENPTRYEVTNEKKFNSRSDEFAPIYADKKYSSIVFTSSREGSTGNRIDDWTGQNFSDLYISQIDRKGDWSNPQLLDEDRAVNTEANEGAAAFDSKFNVLYFTRCEVGKKEVLGCRIYESRRKGRGWAEATMVQIDIDSSVTYGHPTITSDELTLIFASDLKGGFGDKDLWMATRDRKSKPFGKPVNMGANINTHGNEMFPMLRNDTLLYFASDGHPGMGGLDIFKVSLKDGKWGKPENMKFPVNSYADDFGITFKGEEERGFLTSNRSGGRGAHDLYSFFERPLLFTLAGNVRDEESLQFIEGAKVVLEGSDGTTIETLTGSRGDYSFDNTQVLKNTSYELKVSKDGYFGESARETTVGLTENKDFTINFILVPIPEKPIILPEILYDLAKWDLKPQYQDSLIGLIQILEENPTLVIELAAHTDHRDTDERNDTLSQRRAQSVVDYLILRGIHPQRLVAKGYGERVPRRLEKTVTKAGYTFPAGAVLTESYIAQLPGNAVKEAAHQMNRRTEFRILRKDFIPIASAEDDTVAAQINLVLNPDENAVVITQENASFTAECIILGYTRNFFYDSKVQELQVSLGLARELLRNRSITKDDFVGDVETILGGGTIADQAIFNLKTLRIGDNIVTGLQAKVVHDLSYPVVLGDSILDRFGTYQVDKENNLIIFR